MQTWSNINYEDNISSKEQLLSQYLWLNSLIRVNNKPIHYTAWSSQGIQNIGHLMENETRFLSFSEFKERYNVKTNFLSFCGVISAIKHLVITFKKNASHENTNYESFLDKFLKAKNPNRAAYKKLVEKKQKQPVNSQTKWSVDCMIEEMKLLTGRLLTSYLFNVRKYQNFLFFNLNSYTGDWPLIIS